jgi:uncharacterized protein (DUF924 family)
MSLPPEAGRVLAFWFGETADAAETARRQQTLWWGKDAALDREIGERFGRLRQQAAAGALADWERDPQGRLALVLLIDQFSRNLFRGDPASFAQDGLALRWTLDGLEQGADRALQPIHRVFFYLPLEHAESRELQARSVALYAALAGEVPPEQRTLFEGFLDFAVKHRDIVERFGRFPHRNAILGRASTPEERDFLQQPGSSF